MIEVPNGTVEVKENCYCNRVIKMNWRQKVGEWLIFVYNAKGVTAKVCIMALFTEMFGIAMESKL